jgi:hypothetical protein
MSTPGIMHSNRSVPSMICGGISVASKIRLNVRHLHVDATKKKHEPPPMMKKKPESWGGLSEDLIAGLVSLGLHTPTEIQVDGDRDEHP